MMTFELCTLNVTSQINAQVLLRLLFVSVVFKTVSAVNVHGKQG